MLVFIYFERFGRLEVRFVTNCKFKYYYFIFVITARSGLKLENKSCCCKKLEYGRSTYNLCVLEIRSFIHLANKLKTLLCLSVYLDKAALLPQFDNTCLFV